MAALERVSMGQHQRRGRAGVALLPGLGDMGGIRAWGSVELSEPRSCDPKVQ